MPKPSPVRDPLLQSLEEQVLKICEAQPDGVSNGQIFSQIKDDIKPNIRAAVYNKLLTKGRLRIAQRKAAKPDGTPAAPEIIYQFVSRSEASKFRGLDATDRLAYEVVAKSGSQGVTKRDVRMRINMHNAAEVTAVIDRLLQRKLIKEIKSVQGKRRIFYIIAELEVSAEHTGGPWYNDEQEYDTEFIDVMYQMVLAFMRRHPFVTVEQVTEYIASMKVSNEELKKTDLGKLMNTMLYDGAIEEYKSRDDENTVAFRVVNMTPAANHLTVVPCGTCPVFKACEPGGVISPESCPYMSEWLKESVDW